MRPRLSRLYWAATLLVTIFSLYMNLAAVATTAIYKPVRGDAREYISYAYNITTHGVFSLEEPLLPTASPQPDAMRAPGYAVFIAPFVDLTKLDFGTTQILYLQAILGAFTTFFSLLIFSRMMPLWASVGCGLLVAISPHLINTTVYLLSESLFTLLLVAHACTLVMARERNRLALYIVSGILLAATWLVRPTTLLLPLLYMVVLGFAAYKKEINWRSMACLVLPFFIAFCAWSVRNEMATGSMSDSRLTVSFIQNGSYINMMYEDRPETYGRAYTLETKEIKTVGDAIALTFEHFKAEPIRYVSWMLIGKPAQFLAWDLPESIGGAFIYKPIDTPYFTNKLFIATYELSEALHMPLMLLASAACIFFLSRNAAQNFALQACSIITLYFIVIHVAGSPYPRYSIPIRPFCYGLALSMALHIYSVLRANISKRAPAPAS